MDTRWHFVDALRILAFALLVPYHVGMYYVSWDWHVKAAQLVPALEPFMRLTNPWRMSLLFLLSGTAFGLMLASARGQHPWLRARLARLGWPLLFGIVVLVPPQAYFEVVQQHGFRGGYLDFLRLYFSAHGGFCSPARGCLVLPTWNHLWFLVYLIVYTLLFAALLRRGPTLAQRWATRVERWADRPLLVIALPLAYLAATRLWLRGPFPPSFALVDDVFQHSQFLALFALGLALSRLQSAWCRFESLRWVALVLAVAAWAALVLWSPGRGVASVLLVSTQQWCAIVAACGFAHRHLNRDSAWRRRLGEAVLPLYLLHQTVIIVAAMVLAPLALAPQVEGPLLVALAFGVGLAGYVLARRVAWLRPLFGLDHVTTTRAAGVLARPA